MTQTPTSQTNTSRISRKCLSILIQQISVLVISSQIKISKNRCLFDVLLMSIFIDLVLILWSKSHQIDDHNISIQKVLSGQDRLRHYFLFVPIFESRSLGRTTGALANSAMPMLKF